MNLEQARIDFVALQKKLSAFNHATALIYYDGETTAPADTSDNRAQALEILNAEIFKLKTGEETIALLESLNEHRDELTVKERRAIDFMKKELDKKRNIPEKEYVKYETLRTEAQDAWHKASEENDFSILEPYLERVFDTFRKFADYCAPGMDPYEYCLDDYEEGLKVETCDELFDGLRSKITELLRNIQEHPQVDDSCLKGDFSVEDQENLATYVMELIGLNMNRVGLSTAEHPFSTFLGSHFDERIATKYSRKDFTQSLYTVLYEGGHVLYDMGQADNLAYTVMDGTPSMVLLESQSRFYENIIGRSRNFIECIYPELKELFPETIGEYTPEDIYRAVNKVQPGPIRIGSDELTFNLHVMIRYELEKAIMKNELAVKDLPDAWRDKYKEYLGVDVPDDSRGVLQDIHWAFGAIGYFPAYVVGNAIAAQIYRSMSKEIDIEEGVSEGDFSLINAWNREHIWKHGGLYPGKEVFGRFVSPDLDPEPYITYLTEKYSDIYGI